MSFVHEFFSLQNGSVEAGPGIHPEIGDRGFSIDLDIRQQFGFEAGKHVDKLGQILEKEKFGLRRFGRIRRSVG